MTGKEEIKEIHIDLKSIDKKKIMEESETITKFRNDIYNMMQKEIIRFVTPLKFEISELNKEISKYKRAFEILKDNCHISNYVVDGVNSGKKITFDVIREWYDKEEYELLEELMKDE